MIQENLKVLRLKKGMSQEELAVRIHVVRQTVSKWEKGLSVPDAQTLIQNAQALEVPDSAFLGETIQEDTLQIMAKMLEEINTCLAERSARTRRRMRTIAFVMILLAFAGIVLLLLFSTGLLHQPPSGPNIIGGADGATGILIVGTNRFAFGVGMAVCICALIAGGILLHRSKR